MRHSHGTRLRNLTDLLIELRARVGAEAIPLVERWDSDVVAVGRVEAGGAARLVFVILRPSPSERYDVAFEPGPGSFAAQDIDGVERLVRRHLGLPGALSGPRSAA